MSETCGLVTINHRSESSWARSGRRPRVEIRLATDGEVLIKADCVMPGYRNSRRRTRGVHEDGWLRTGDIGEIDEDGYLRSSTARRS
jgi:long-chain acyl-CoA synthetase